MVNTKVKFTVLGLQWNGISAFPNDYITIQQHDKILYKYSVDGNSVNLNMNASKIIDSALPVYFKHHSLIHETTKKLDLLADGLVKNAIIEFSVLPKISESLTLTYKADMFSGYVILDSDGHQILLGSAPAPQFYVTIPNQLSGNPLDDCFFYQDKNMVLLSEFEEREKEITVLGSDDFGFDDIWKDILDHYKIEPPANIDPFPDPIGPVEENSIWENVIDAVDSNSGIKDKLKSNPVFADIFNDPSTIVSMDGISYRKDGEYSSAVNSSSLNIGNIFAKKVNAVKESTPELNTLKSKESENSINLTSTHNSEYLNIFKGIAKISNGISLGHLNLPSRTGKISEKKYVFKAYCHSKTHDFIRTLSYGGIESFLKRSSQNAADTLNFKISYLPNPDFVFLEKSDIPKNLVAFEFGGAYSQYNWELFFHIPMTIAGKLSRDQKFAQAQKWYHSIFDPTASESGGKDRFWQFMPFNEEAKKKISTLSDLLKGGEEILKQIDLWEKHPFSPHIIARMRLSAYMKNVVMKYLDNIISWADNLFMRDTLEAINEATNLYILAAKILGPKPQRVPSRAEPIDQCYNTFKKDKWCALTNALVEIEHFIPPSSCSGSSVDLSIGSGASNAIETMLYFGIIPNEKLLGYWDTIADRLFKIRHSMNIDGVERTLALFEPPIDPAMLVKAAAAGIATEDLLNESLNSDKSNYRFTFMIHKARQFAEELKVIGHDLLGYIEKSDAEGLTLLRQSLDSKILESVKSIKESSLEESKIRIESVKKSLEAATVRRDFYAGRELTNDNEKSYLDSLDQALKDIDAQKVTETIASIVAAIPDFKIGCPTTVGTTFGGTNLAKATMAMASYYSGGVGQSNIEGAKSSAMGSYNRRMDDWNMQAKSSKKEIEQLEKELLIAEIRQEICQKELDTQIMQIENSKAVLDFMTYKFTSTELYDWLISEVSGIYFQSYKLAVNMAKKAQECYKNELMKSNASFIEVSYWNSLKKGLLAADGLLSNISIMESNYMDNNGRNEFELTKNISLGMINPVSLLDLKYKGTTSFEIPELLFDLDYPGHYGRRIKSVSLSIYCVTGPFTTINATLRLNKHYTRKIAPTNNNPYYNSLANIEEASTANICSIATSTAQNDSGMFEVNFNDERYLPFEGCGAVSRWTIDLIKNENLRQFDYSTINDVVLHMKYTAREDTNSKEAVIKNIQDELEKISSSMPLYSYINVRNELPSQWYSFLNPLPDTDSTLEIPINKSIFPYFARVNNIVITNIGLHATKNTKSEMTFTLSYSKSGLLQEQAGSCTELPTQSKLIHTFNVTTDPLKLADIDDGLLNLVLNTGNAKDLDNFILTVQYYIEHTT